MSYFVYIIFSKRLNRFYIGFTKDLDNRIQEHNSGESPYTSQGMPWKLIWTTTKSTTRSAEVLEQKLKNLSRDRKIKFIKKYKEGIRDPDIFNEKNSC